MVGSGIINIITESLYDNPIVVFREYVQNSVDSLYRSQNSSNSDIRIFFHENNLYFVDNGDGIVKESFKEQMLKIADSTKSKKKNIGYKGIGRLSGLPYCKLLRFVNVYDYEHGDYKQCMLNGEKYTEEKNSDKIQGMSADEFIESLSLEQEPPKLLRECYSYNKIDEFFEKYNKGFMVILNNVTPVLQDTISSPNFELDLSWLLPVDFLTEMYSSNSQYAEIFESLRGNNEEGAAVRSCNIFYNDTQLHRPICEESLRNIVCKTDFEFAIGIQTFNSQKIAIDRNNVFNGIRIYIDNMLLCDENELVQNLSNFGMLKGRSVNSVIQAVRGIGAVIYVTDKINISANARRTFIEVTDSYALDFLELVAEYINNVYEARYALSNYASALRDKSSGLPVDVMTVKENALNTLRKMVQEKVEIEAEDESDMKYLSGIEKKKMINRSISTRMKAEIKQYVAQCKLPETKEEMNNCFNEFFSWVYSKYEFDK